VLGAPLVKKAAIAQGNVVSLVDAKALGGAVDPFGRSFELGVVADGGFVNHAMAFAVLPLGAPFFVTKGGYKTQREEDLGESAAIGDFGLGFDAVLMAIFSRAVVGQALVGDGPAAGIAADAENFGTGTHAAVGGVVENVALKAARGVKGESRSLELLGEGGQVGHAEFDFGFDGHGKERVYGSAAIQG